MGEANLYKRGATFWLRATANGKEYRESLRTADVKRARQIRDKRLAEIADAAHRGIVKHTWEEAVSEWLEHVMNQIGSKTLLRYGVSLKQVEPFLTGLEIASISGATIQSLITSRRKVATVATVKRDLTAISQVLKFAEANEWREGNPALSKAGLLKERRDPIVLPAIADIMDVMSASSTRFKSLTEAALLTGLRQAELVNLTWRQFNPKARTLDIIGKGNKRRTIQLSEEANRHIQSAQRTPGSDLIFCHEDGRPFRNASSDFRRCLRHAIRDNPGIRPFRFHDLRHLFAVESLRSGMGIYALSKHLGHTSVVVTERSYLAFLTPEEAEAAKAKAA